MKTLIVLSALCLSACAGAPIVYDKEGQSQAGFDQDQRECKYDVIKNTQSVDPGMQSLIGQEIDRAMRQKSLMRECMESRGYSARS
jgi:hypothetical protein